MKLPNNEVGISDILNYRECPMNFAFAMRRHTDMPEHLQVFYRTQKDVPPEHDNENNAYGSAIHDVIHIVETTRCSDDEAISQVWPRYQRWLWPSDIDRLKEDLETFHMREEVGVRLIASEAEMRVPLFVYKGEQIYFRFRVDRLVQSLTNPGLYFSRDYKSSRWRKSEDEVHGDLQQWSYNWGLHEYFPEIVRLHQVYDQLRFGEVPTSKNDNQRRQIKRWLIEQVTAILEDDVLEPQQNDMCQFCPLVVDCPETVRSTKAWKRRLAVLAPEEKVGRKIIVQLTDDPEEFSAYTDVLPEVQNVKKILTRYEEAVKAVLRDMPDSVREEHGYKLVDPNTTRFGPSALKEIANIMGDEFWQVVSLSKSQLESWYGKGDELDAVLELSERAKGTPQVKPV